MPLIPHTSDWEEYRRRRRDFLAIYLIGAPVSGLIAFSTAGLGFNDVGVGLLVAAFGVLWLFAILRLAAFDCPRCTKPFFHHTLAGNPLTGECLHCGLPKWETCTETQIEAWATESDWQCLNCHANVPSTTDACNACGWSYDDEN